MCVCVCVCVCVCARARSFEQQGGRGGVWLARRSRVGVRDGGGRIGRERERGRACVCVCA